jgi:hypothetical protein
MNTPFGPFDAVFCVVGGKDDLTDATRTQVLGHLNGAVRIGTTGPVHLSIDGYDDDPRELWEIPEVCAYLRGVFLNLHPDVAARLDELSRIIGAVSCGLLRPVGRDPVTGNTRFEPVAL